MPDPPNKSDRLAKKPDFTIRLEEKLAKRPDFTPYLPRKGQEFAKQPDFKPNVRYFSSMTLDVTQRGVTPQIFEVGFQVDVSGRYKMGSAADLKE